jgi:hypothetical protein
MKYKKYLIESNGITDVLNKLGSLGYKKAEEQLQGSTKKILQLLIDKGMQDEALIIINKHLKTHFKSFKDINKLTRVPIKESSELINEDIKHLWSFITDQAWGGMVFYPMLQLYMELDKLLVGSGVDIKKTLVYFAIFLFILSAKHLQLYKKWKKDNPVDWELEGRPNAFIGKQGIRPEIKQQLKSIQDNPTLSRTTGRLGFKTT